MDRTTEFRGPIDSRIVIPAPHSEPGDSEGSDYRAVKEVAFAGVTEKWPPSAHAQD